MLAAAGRELAAEALESDCVALLMWQSARVRAPESFVVGVSRSEAFVSASSFRIEARTVDSICAN